MLTIWWLLKKIKKIKNTTNSLIKITTRKTSGVDTEFHDVEKGWQEILAECLLKFYHYASCRF